MSKMTTLKNTGFWYFLLIQYFFYIFTLIISQSLLTISFSEKKNQYYLSGPLKYFAQTVTNFLLPSAENTKNESFLKL